MHNGNPQRALQITREILTDSTVNDQSNAKRPLLLSESSWVGSGSLGVAVITDLYRSWESLKFMINQAISMSMYGFSNTMVDTCGSLGPIDEELCARWIQIAAFMPLYRNYFNDTFINRSSNQRVAG